MDVGKRIKDPPWKWSQTSIINPTAQATNTERCPVRYYKAFKSHHPAEMNSSDSPFYLAINHRRKPNDNTWYMKAPLGKNEIGNLLKKAAERAGLQGNITNHSVRKTCISRLMDAEVPVNYVAQLSGHRNLKSLDSYKSASVDHQRKMSFVLAEQISSTCSRQILDLPVLQLPPAPWSRLTDLLPKILSKVFIQIH